MPKTKTKLTREFYDSLVEAFRLIPGNASAAARRVNCEPRMARRGWSLGWPQYSWAIPIKDALDLEKIDAQAEARSARKRAEEAAEAAREAARQEHIDALKKEQQILQTARGDVLAVLGIAMSLVPAMRELAAIIGEALRVDPATGKRSREVSPKEAMGLLTKHAQIVQKGVGAAEAVIQLSRLDRGASNLNVGLAGAAPEETMSFEEAIEEFERLSQVMRGARPLLSPGSSADTDA